MDRLNDRCKRALVARAWKNKGVIDDHDTLFADLVTYVDRLEYFVEGLVNDTELPVSVSLLASSILKDEDS